MPTYRRADSEPPSLQAADHDGVFLLWLERRARSLSSALRGFAQYWPKSYPRHAAQGAINSGHWPRHSEGPGPGPNLNLRLSRLAIKGGRVPFGQFPKKPQADLKLGR